MASDAIRFFWPKFDGVADDESPTVQTVDAGSTVSAIVCDDANLSGADDTYIGAIIEWVSGTNTEPANVTGWDLSETTLAIDPPLARAPSAGDTFILHLMSGASSTRSNSEIEPLRFYVSQNITDDGASMSIVNVANECGTGAGKLSYDADAETLSFREPLSSTYGSAVDVSGGDGTYTLYGNDSDKWIEITLADTADLPTTDTVDTVLISNKINTIASHISGAESHSGTVRYVLLPIKNVSASTVDDISIYCEPRSDATTTLSGDMASDAESVTLASGDGFPSCGFWLYNSDQDDARYVRSRSGNHCDIIQPQTNHRGLTATAWNDGDTLSVYPDVDIALATPVGATYPASLAGLTYSAPTTASGGLSIATLAADGIDGVCARETIPAGAEPRADVPCRISVYFDSAYTTSIDLRHDIYTRAGYEVYAREMASPFRLRSLGFIADGDTTLDNVTLPDGDWEIEARPCGRLWKNLRSTKTVRLTLSGGAISSSLPGIVGVSSRRWQGRTAIMFTVPDTYDTDVADVALWFSSSSPVDTSGDPDATVDASGAGVYQYLYDQSELIYVALRARDSLENKGAVAEMLLPWVPASVDGPDDQYNERGE